MSEKNNPKYRKTKRYTKRSKRTFTIDDARNVVMKIKQIEGLSKHTLESYEKVFNDLDRYFGEKTDINSLTVDDARDFIKWETNEKTQFLKTNRKSKKKGVSTSTVNTYLTILKTSFFILLEEGILNTNIFESIQPLKKKEKKIETLTVEEIRKILRTMDKRIYSELRAYCICLTMLDSFGRINEILSLQKQDLSIEHQTLTFRNTKNGKVRIVPISKKTVKYLLELIEENEDFFNGEYIFLTNHGKQLRPDTFRKHFRELVERAGIKRRVHPHLFRHTASEMFLRGTNGTGGSIRVLQQILGHADLSTTSIYAHVLDNTIKNQHNQYSPLNFLEEKRKTRTRRSKS